MDPRTKRIGLFSNNQETTSSPVRIYRSFTSETPEVSLDKKDGSILFIGRCITPDPAGFFSPLLLWAFDYVKQPQDITTVVINTDYLNTTCTVYLRHFLAVLARVQYSGRKIIIKWYCNVDDDDTHELIDLIEEAIKVRIQR